jgi:hypothetical protein
MIPCLKTPRDIRNWPFGVDWDLFRIISQSSCN